MPKRNDIKKVLVLGSGPIIIGQAAEFDYAGTQACRALKEDNLEVVLINSNPATIMTDKNIADKVYIEPMTCEVVKNIILAEKPDSILPTLGGQTGLNLAMELAEQGFLHEQGVKLLGTNVDAIRMAEDRQDFKDTMERIGEPCIASKVVNNLQDALDFAREIEYPVIVRPAYTLGGTGGGIAADEEQLAEIAGNGLRLSRVNQVLIEKCIAGWKEIEFEVMRDSKGNCITICSMENIDPVGVHTGDSIVVAPAQTLLDEEYKMLRSASLKIISALGIEGGCNVQFALKNDSLQYAVIEVNPRVSRSSALASKATGYPIAKVASKIAIGYTLDEIVNAVTKKTYAFFEPTVDYCVVKLPKWPFDKFVAANRTLGTQMMATGEVMAIGNSLEAALMKAVRSAELKLDYLSMPSLTKLSDVDIRHQLYSIDDQRLFVIAEAIRRGITLEDINDITKIDLFFLNKIKNLIDTENELKNCKGTDIPEELLKKAKKQGFLDSTIASFTGATAEKITKYRKSLGIHPSFKMVDTCAAEFDAVTPYYYSTYDEESESVPSSNKKVLVLGSGPIRIGQGIEFDYCSVHCVWALKELGYETIIVNCNPETVSTDFDTADKLYFEPLTREDVGAIIETELPIGAIIQFGGQTAINFVNILKDFNLPVLGTSPENVDAAEDREKFDKILEKCGIPRPAGRMVFTTEQALKAATELGYPVLVRPSYVLGGQGMEIAYNDEDIVNFMSIINRHKQEHPILVDKYLMGKELEVDAICDGKDILIPGIMEHLERAGVHSGDSISVYPTQSVPGHIIKKVIEYTEKLARALNVVGLINIQFVLHDNELYVIEVNPRSSRTVPYISKVTNIPMVKIATGCIMGKKLTDYGYGTGLMPNAPYVAVKVPVFSFEKLHGVDISLGPEMKSTGEVLGVSKTFEEALYKGLLASGLKVPPKGGVLITVRDTDKAEVVGIAKELFDMGYSLYATEGTVKALASANIPSTLVHKIGYGKPDTLSLISSGKVVMLINTPGKDKQAERDGLKIRRKAIEQSLPCFTSLDTVNGMLTTMKHSLKEKDLSIIDIARI